MREVDVKISLPLGRQCHVTVIAAVEKETIKYFRFNNPSSYSNVRNVISDLTAATPYAQRNTARAARTQPASPRVQLSCVCERADAGRNLQSSLTSRKGASYTYSFGRTFPQLAQGMQRHQDIAVTNVHQA